MENKDTNIVNSAPAAPVAAPAAPTKNWFRRAGDSIANASKKSWAWIKSRDLSTTANVAVLLLTIVMLVVLIQVVQQNNQIINSAKSPAIAAAQATKQVAPRPARQIVSARVPASVSVDTATGTTAIVLPMKDVIKQIKQTKPVVGYAKPLTNREWLRQESSFRRTPARVSKLDSMSRVSGNLYVQNMNAYTLPCGTIVQGDLIVRNVKKLKFCGCFEVKGNIYLGRGVSFGPLPRDAKIGGQIIH